ncbi:flagellin modification protein A [Gammaproteobacteria bacterium 45_16_T64]|nr:flagellin modification protein A [Gammaproteobacteria bacterium 45_16_T64]
MLDNEKIVVVGAGGLLGTRVVATLLARGASVIALDIDVENMRTKLSSNGISFDNANLCCDRLDVNDEDDVKSFFSSLVGMTGAVNCCYPRNENYGKALLDVSLDSFNQNLTLNIGSTFLFSQQCLVYFLENKARISLVNISSVYGVVAPSFDVYDNTSMTMPVEYAAIKAAVIHLNRYFAAYAKDSNFRINSVSPGGVLDKQPTEFLERYKSKCLGKGMLNTEDVVGTIMFLLSDDSKYINGQNIIVDDGFTL